MAVWSNPLLTQVMSPKLASTSAVSTRRSTAPRGVNSFNTDYNDLTTTVAASETPDMKKVGQSTSPLLFQVRAVSSNHFCVSGFQQQAATSGSQPQASSSVINADFSSTRKLVRGDETIASVEGTLSRGKRDRDLESAQTLSERRNLHAHLEQKVELAVPGECAAQKRLSGAEAEMDMRNWEPRNADIALHETNRELESQRLEHQASQWAIQAQREKIFFELDMREESSKKIAQDIAKKLRKLRRICCEETERARQLRIDDLSMQQERNPSIVRKLLTQIQDLQKKVNSLERRKRILRS